MLETIIEINALKVRVVWDLETTLFGDGRKQTTRVPLRLSTEEVTTCQYSAREALLGALNVSRPWSIGRVARDVRGGCLSHDA